MSLGKVPVPDLGHVQTITVIELMVKPGDRVTKDAVLLVLESDKAVTEIPSPFAGIIASVRPKPGDVVQTGDLLAEKRFNVGGG